MRTVDDLRAALADDGTPAGVDLAAVRRRARQRARRTAAAAVGVAAAVAAAVAVPTALVGGGGTAVEPANRTAAPAAAEDCPTLFPDPTRNTGPGLADRLVPFQVETGLLCEYGLIGDMRPPTYSKLAGSRPLSAAVVRDLVARLERGTVQDRPPACYHSDPPAEVLRLAGAGRLLSLRVDPSECAQVTNGTRHLYAPTATAAVLAAVKATPTRLSCPAAIPSGPSPTGPADRLVPFRPVRVLICLYREPVGPYKEHARSGPPFRWELDGADAAAYVRRLEALPTRVATCGGLHPGMHENYAILVVGSTGRITLVGYDYDCSAASNGRRTVYGNPLVAYPQPPTAGR